MMEYVKIAGIAAVVCLVVTYLNNAGKLAFLQPKAPASPPKP